VDPWHDAVLIEYLDSLDKGAVVAVNAPLTVPACVRCQLAACPGKQVCEDPAVVWLRTEGAEIVDQAIESDRDRIVAIPGGHGGHGAHGSSTSRRAPGRLPRSKPRIEPYVHRGSEIIMHYERGLLPRDSLGAGISPISARGAHLRRVLATMGFELNRNLLEVSPRATVHALFGARQARGYKRNADPWESRVAIIESLKDMRFATQSRLAREDVLRNDHCFEALLSSYTAYLWARDGWALPDELFTADGWIWTPPGP
jgi:predicted nuclease with RNAse H fold